MPAQRRPRWLLRAATIAAASIVVVGIALGVLALAVNGRSHTSAPAPTTVPTSAPATTSTTSTTVPGAWVEQENAKAGTSAWTLSRPSTTGQMEGYANVVSAQRGDQLTLYTTTTAPDWTATAYRLGWYGGKLAREVWQSPVEPGRVQPSAMPDPVTNTVEAHWRPSLSVTVGADWTPGDYLFKLRSTAGWDSYVPLTVRDDSSQAALLIQNSVTTWQAYNQWGGYSLYQGPGPNPGALRATMVSFDRPYRLGDGSGDFLGNELPLVKTVERLGLDVTYTTSIDTDEHPSLLLRHRAFVSLGHDEYWSTAMRDGVTAARDHGVNLLFLGANAVYRHIRLEASSLGGDRREVNYRVAADDPERLTNPAEVTVQWRDPPVSKPESSLLGEQYECNPVHADFVVTEPASWIFASAPLPVGSRLPGIVGAEYDHWSPAEHGPTVELIARSPVVCRGHASTSDFTYYVAPSGAGVIDTGTSQWVPSLDYPSVADTVLAVTTTILHEFALGPVSAAHPAQPSVGAGSQSTGPVPPGE